MRQHIVELNATVAETKVLMELVENSRRVDREPIANDRGDEAR
jgi:hypothetical protein